MFFLLGFCKDFHKFRCEKTQIILVLFYVLLYILYLLLLLKDNQRSSKIANSYV